MMRKMFLAFGLSALLQGAAQAQDSSNLFGVWSGTIGNLPVVVCLDTKRDYHFGSYFYRSHLKAINLTEKEDGTAWIEGNSDDKTAPHWQLQPVQDNTVAGSWLAQGKSLPIKLARIGGKLKDGDGEESACGSDVFFRPRITPPKITQTPATLDGQVYVKVSVDVGKQFDVTLETFKLTGPGPKITAINKMLLSDLPVPGKKPGYLECIQNALTNGGNDGDYSVSIAPVVLTSHWLVAATGDGSFCGGAHPANSSSETVYDLRKGAEVDLKKWLQPGIADENGALSGKLAKLVEDKYKADAKDNTECIDSIQNAFGWSLSLAQTGISFQPSLSYAEHVCEEKSVISFADVMPFLNDSGKKHLAGFRSELPK
jgi:hypothetical protein